MAFQVCLNEEPNLIVERELKRIRMNNVVRGGSIHYNYLKLSVISPTIRTPDMPFVTIAVADEAAAEALCRELTENTGKSWDVKKDP